MNKAKKNNKLPNRYDIAKYGLEIQKKQAMLSQILLRCINMSEADDVNSILTELVDFIERIDEYDDIQFFEGKNPLVISERYERIIARVDGFSENIEKYMVSLAKEKALLTYLNTLCLECGAAFDKVIKEGKEILEEMEDWNLSNCLEARLMELGTAKDINLRQQPTIDILIKNCDMISEKIRATLYNTIPLWKTQITAALSNQNLLRFNKNRKNLNELTSTLLISGLNELSALQNENRNERNEAGRLITS